MTTSPPSTEAPVPNANDGETIARTLLERAPVLVYVVDLNFKVVLMNRELREVSGWDTSSCGDIEHLLTNFYPDPSYREPIRAIHYGWGRTPSEQVRDTVMVLTTADGRQRSISWTTARLRVGRGPVRGYIALGVDVTTRRNLEHWVTLFQQSLLQMKEGLSLIDLEGNVLAWSAGATALLGHSESSTQGNSLHSLLDGAGDEDTASQALTAALATDNPAPFTAVLRTDDGDVRSLELEVSRIAGPSGEVLAHLVQMSELGESPDSGPDTQAAELRADEAETAAQDAQAAQAAGEAAAQDAQAAQAEAEAAAQDAEAAQAEAEAAAQDAQAAQAEAERAIQEAEAGRAAAETRVDLAEDTAEELRADIEAGKAHWDEERASLVRSHVADRDALVESSAEERAAFIKRMETERAELEEQLRQDILAAEERAEGQLEAQEKVHGQARKEWDDAMVIAAHEMAGRMSVITEQISQILIEGADSAGNLPAEAISKLAQLIGGPAIVPAGREDDSASDFDLSADDLILDDEGEEAIDAPPPVSPAMVATASELEAHVPGTTPEAESELDPEAESELELEAESELDLEAVSELELEQVSELELEPVSDLNVEPIPGLDEIASKDLEEGDDLDLDLDDEDEGPDLAQEPTEEDLDSDSDSDDKSVPKPPSGESA